METYWCDKQTKINIPYKYQEFVMIMWSCLLYGTYTDLDKYIPLNNLKKYDQEINKYVFLALAGERETDDFEDLHDFFTNDFTIFGQNLVDKSFLSLTEKLKKPLTIYRSGQRWKKDKIGFVSTSKLEDNAAFFAGILKQFDLPIGFPIIDTDRAGKSYCDGNEVIVRYEDLMLLNQNKIL